MRDLLMTRRPNLMGGQRHDGKRLAIERRELDLISNSTFVNENDRAQIPLGHPLLGQVNT